MKDESSNSVMIMIHNVMTYESCHKNRYEFPRKNTIRVQVVLKITARVEFLRDDKWLAQEPRE